jgi:cell division protein YceG involved in septum cleavage
MISDNPLMVVRNSSRLRSSISLSIAIFLVSLFIASSAWYVGASKIPSDFPLETDVVIAEGMTHQEIAEHLETLGVISSSLLFQTILSR